MVIAPTGSSTWLTRVITATRTRSSPACRAGSCVSTCRMIIFSALRTYSYVHRATSLLLDACLVYRVRRSAADARAIAGYHLCNTLYRNILVLHRLISSSLSALDRRIASLPTPLMSAASRCCDRSSSCMRAVATLVGLRCTAACHVVV